MSHLLCSAAHERWRQRIREFAETKVKPEILDFDAREDFPVELIREAGRYGLFGVTVPESLGGSGLDFLSYIIAVEELARADSSVAATIAAHNSLGIAPIMEYGSATQKQKYIPGLCTGNRLWAFGLTEDDAGSDSQGVQTTAHLANGIWCLQGAKMFITNGASALASGITVEAITGINGDRKELSVILVDRETPGYSVAPVKGKLVWRAVDNARITLENCVVPAENLLGERGQGGQIMLRTLDSGRLSIAAIGLGLSVGAYEMALAYARSRRQFGKPLTDFQANAFKIADMATNIEMARNSLYYTCLLKEKGLPFAREAAMVKLFVARIANDIATEAMQLFGARGFLHENHIERFYRDQRLLSIGEGTNEILKLVISRSILKEAEQHDRP